MHFSWSLLVLCALVPAALCVNPLVELGYSSYYGTAQTNGITSWLGMRYAAPPLGDLRWRAPAAPLSTNVTQVANTNGPICLPSPGEGPPSNTTSEDCLFLDVFAPSNATADSKLPVFFWIQGGGFNANSNANYRGDGLIMASEMNMVVVTFNYRVGLYGFLASQEVLFNGAVNVGLLDQRAAMEWVQSYISCFGGDPGHVTIGGCSAGGASVTFHLTNYGGRDDGLFHAAAAESASVFNILTVPESQYQYDAFVERVGCAAEADSLTCLRGLNATYLQANNIFIPYPGLGPNASAPLFMYDVVIDGDMVQDLTERMFAEGNFIKVPVIYGDDTNGGTNFAPITTANVQQMDQFMIDNYPTFAADQITTVNYLYPESTQFNGTGAYWRAASNAYGEMAYMCPGMAVNTAYQTYSTAGSWNYRYNVMDPTQMAEGYGVPHTVEANAIWGPEYVTSTPPASYYTTNAGIIPVIQGYWTSFIRSYSPNTYRVLGTPIWQEWDPILSNRLMFETNATAMETVELDLQARCAYWAANGISLLQ